MAIKQINVKFYNLKEYESYKMKLEKIKQEKNIASLSEAAKYSINFWNKVRENRPDFKMLVEDVQKQQIVVDKNIIKALDTILYLLAIDKNITVKELKEIDIYKENK